MRVRNLSGNPGLSMRAMHASTLPIVPLRYLGRNCGSTAFRRKSSVDMTTVGVTDWEADQGRGAILHLKVLNDNWDVGVPSHGKLPEWTFRKIKKLPARNQQKEEH